MKESFIESVGMEADLPLAAHQADPRHRLDRAELVVDRHHRDEPRPLVEQRLQLVHVDDAVAPDVRHHHLGPLLAQDVDAFENRRMLEPADDHPVSRLAVGRPVAQDGRVVGLGAAAGERHAGVAGAELFPQELVDLDDLLPRFAAGAVQAGWIRPGAPAGLNESFDHLVAHRGGGPVVKITTSPEIVSRQYCSGCSALDRRLVRDRHGLPPLCYTYKSSFMSLGWSSPPALFEAISA
jgi:hypothetical protein